MVLERSDDAELGAIARGGVEQTMVMCGTERGGDECV